MIIKNMDASFGGLENAHMELEPGLNIIEAPNEAGKSTWCGFIRTMLYGINTSQREKAGQLPDKKRFLPWGNYPMTGSMRLEWRGGDVTLHRKGAAGKPMGSCEAQISGTAEKVPELCGKAPGEIILGIPESVFRRSAFISGGAMAVDRDAELEKRISALITSGSEEDEAYSTARATLHNWRVKRKHNARVGRVAELEGRIAEKSAALGKMSEENARLGGIYAEREEALARVGELENELYLHDVAKIKAEHEKAAAAEAARERAAAELEKLRREAGDITDAKIAAARTALSEYREAAAEKRAGEDVIARHAAAKAGLERAENHCRAAAEAARGVSAAGIAAARRALFEYENARAGAEKTRDELTRFAETAAAAPEGGKKPGAALAAAAVIMILFGLAGFAVYFAAPLFAVLIAAALLTVAGAAMLLVFLLRKRSHERRAAAADKAKKAELAVYENLAKEAGSRSREAERELMDALAAIGGETIPERAGSRIDEREALLNALEQAKNETAAALQVERSLAPALDGAYAAAEKEKAASATLCEALAALDIDPAAMNIPARIEEKDARLNALRRAESTYDGAQKLKASLGELPELPENVEELPQPRMERDEAQSGLESARVRAAELERMLAVSEGELRHLGDPLVVSTELENLRTELAETEEEYDALSLAISVLDEANAELQQRFSPIVGSLAGKLMSAMTGGAYDRVGFDREFNFTAARENGAERGAEYLSTGTTGQLYLAVRLAICLLALPEGESCPIILDDALLGFDDQRARAALELLCDLAKERQIILFTCQSREKRIYNDIVK